MIWRARTAISALALALVAMAGSAPASLATPSSGPKGSDGLPVFGPGRAYQPVIDPANFSPNVDNPLFPLPPGRTLVYSGTKDRKQLLDVFAITAKTQVVDGVTTRVVEDRGFLDGRLEERTRDYYAQDSAGNVWYFGEDTAELDAHGRVTSTEGSFHAGIDGAQPGVFMQAQPEVGRKFRQEWSAGHAEDQFKVLSLSAPVTVPHGSSPNALKTSEITALEPRVVDNKYYARGIGEVEELAVKGPLEKLQLIDVIG